MLTVNSELHEELRRRKKGAHISTDQCQYLEGLNSKFPMHHKLIQTMSRLSKATCRRIRSDNSLHSEHNEWLYQWKKDFDISPEAKELIRLALATPQRPASIKDLKNLVLDKLNEDLSYYSVRNFVKKELRYSFK